MTAVTNAPNRLKSFLLSIQAPVRDQLAGVETEMEAIMTSELPTIQEVIKHLMRMRGKQFRPTLALLSSAIAGRAEPRAVTVAASIELMHLATLIHDDSVDHSVLRRGLPSVNSMFSHEVSVIMGDLLYSRALSTLVDLGDLRIVKIVTEVTSELAMGEMRQLAQIDRLISTETEYFATIRAKTASLLSSSCEAGALCGAPDYRQAMARYGDRLGMGFQIIDDILDYTGDAAVTGKPGGLDLREHKITLPLIAALPRMKPAGRQRVDALFATDGPSDELVAEVMGIVAEAGGLEVARQHGERFMREAEQALSTVPESPARSALGDAITYVMERRS